MNAISPIPSSICLRSRGATKKGLITSTGECGTDSSTAARKRSVGGKTHRPTDLTRQPLLVRNVHRLTAYDQTWSKVPFWNGKASALASRTVEPNPLEMADVGVPFDLVRLIEGGPRALEAAQQALDYLFGEAQNKLGPRGERLVHRAADVRLHP